MVSGGPYGLEELAQKVGLRRGDPVVVAAARVELADGAHGGRARRRAPGGGWLLRVGTPRARAFWGFQEAWLSLVASVFDMAIYPTLFALYLGRFVPALAPRPSPWGAR